MTTWSQFFEQEKPQTYFQETLDYVANKRADNINVYPVESDVFNAFSTPKFEQIKVVILGQDPYHGPNQAHGFCFSVNSGIKPPPSLVNIYKELAQDISTFEIPTHGNLLPWAKQGVMLLNTVLTVEQGQAHSHKHLGWEHFTDQAITFINDNLSGVIFLLWGAHAQKKGKQINLNKHHVLIAPHPSPLSAHRGFLGCGHFSKVNQLLAEQGKQLINWQV